MNIMIIERLHNIEWHKCQPDSSCLILPYLIILLCNIDIVSFLPGLRHINMYVFLLEIFLDLSTNIFLGLSTSIKVANTF